MSRLLFKSSLFAVAFAGVVLAQSCNDPTFLLCTAPTNVDALAGTSGADITDYTLFDWSAIDTLDTAVIGKRQLKARQTTDESVVCCNPNVDCLVLKNIPFCYVSRSCL